MSTRLDPAARPGTPDAAGPPDRYLLPYLVHRVAARFEQLWRAEQGGRGATIHRWQVLSILMHVDGQRVGHIADMASVAQPVLSRVIDQMERDGLVERRAMADDLRGVRVWTTEQGRATFAALLPRAAALVDRAIADFDEGDVAALHALLSRLLAALETVQEPA